MNYKTILQYFFVFTLATIFAVGYFYFQPQIIAGNGCGWDGIEYSKIFNNIVSNSNIAVSFPFCNRIGTPFLASIIGIQDIFLSFKIVNTFFAILFSLVIYAISRSVGFNFYYSMFSFFLTVGLFFSPIRFIPFYPVYTDPAFLALLAISFLFLIKHRFGLSFFFLFIAFPFREAAIYIAPVFLFFSFYLDGIKKNILYKFAFAFIGIIITKVLISYYFNCNGSQIKTAIMWAYKGLSDPQRFISFIAAISMTAAPMIYIKDIPNLSKIEKISILGFLISAALAFVGGSDSTRIFYSFFPIYFIAIISTIRAKGYIFSFVSLLGYMVVNRFGTKILEPLNYLPSKDESGLFWQFPDHARPEVAILILSIWLVLFTLFEKVLRKKDFSLYY